jgi:hypothetical protein
MSKKAKGTSTSQNRTVSKSATSGRYVSRAAKSASTGSGAPLRSRDAQARFARVAQELGASPEVVKAARD